MSAFLPMEEEEAIAAILRRNDIDEDTVGHATKHLCEFVLWIKENEAHQLQGHAPPKLLIALLSTLGVNVVRHGKLRAS